MNANQSWKALGSVEDAIITIVGDHYGLYGRTLDSSLDLIKDLNSDSIDYLEIIMTLEELFGCSIQNNPPHAPTSIGELISICLEATSSKNGVPNNERRKI